MYTSASFIFKRGCTLHKILLLLLASLSMISNAHAARQAVPEALFPLTAVISTPDTIELYPSVAGDHLVYSLRYHNEYSVIQLNKNTLEQTKAVIPMQPHEAIRFGQALADGQIMYASNRMGPFSLWLRNSVGEGHTLLANHNTFSQGLMPLNPSISQDRRFVAFDSTLQKTRRAIILRDYADGYLNIELLGQTWRNYHSAFFRYTQGYSPTVTGTRNKYHLPSVFLVDREKVKVTMIYDAQNPVLSPDGQYMIFARDTNGNYDLWLQRTDGSQLQRLTDTNFGEFEAAWSPDGQKIAFVSNRDAEGDVRLTSIYVMDLNSKQTVRLTNSPRATDGGPTWKDQHTILFHSNRDPAHWQADTVNDWNIWSVQVPQ